MALPSLPYKGGVAERERSCLSSGNAEDPDSQKVILESGGTFYFSRASARSTAMLRTMPGTCNVASDNDVIGNT